MTNALIRNQHARFALAHPVYDPFTEITTDHGWQEDNLSSVVLTVNIGDE